jgi:hypothetical protein
MSHSKTKNPKEEKIIHIRLDYDEAVVSRRDILRTQKDLLQFLASFKKYHLIRRQELKTKELLYKKLKELKANINKLDKSMPKIKIPDIIKSDEEKEDKKESKKTKEVSGKDLGTSDLEKELAEIQKKLKELE